MSKRYTPGDVMPSAVVSNCGKYRYALGRFWDGEKPPCLFVMLNPSTADATNDDATIKKCMKFAKSWGFGSIEVVNLFPYRVTDKKELKNHLDELVNDGDDQFVLDSADSVNDRKGKIICGWGTDGVLLGRDKEVLELLKPYKLYALHVTQDGHPGHPLYLKDSTKPKLFKGKGKV